jgi:hypothetical protein
MEALDFYSLIPPIYNKTLALTNTYKRIRGYIIVKHPNTIVV